MPTKVSDVFNKLEALEKGLLSRFENLEDKVEKLVHPAVGAPPASVLVPAVEPLPLAVTTPNGHANEMPVPLEWRQIVNDVLNPSFGLSIEYLKDRPAFSFNILVPDKYSNMTPSQRQMQGVDLRPKVIENWEGANGIKAWVELVFKSFDQVTQANIVNDRIKQ